MLFHLYTQPIIISIIHILINKTNHNISDDNKENKSTDNNKSLINFLYFTK